MRDFSYSILKEINFSYEIRKLVNEIYRYQGRLDMFLALKPNSLDSLIPHAFDLSVKASNEIEGITISSARFKNLMMNSLKDLSLNDQLILGYSDVYHLISDEFPKINLSKNYILELHKILYGETDINFGGKFKNVQNYIVGNGQVIFTPVEPFLTSDCIDRICEQYNIMIGNNEIEPLIMIPIFIHDFLCIHPFNDGNGRMSRLLTALLLYRSGFTISKYISIENKINDNKDLYYEALRKAQYGWNEGKEDCSSFILYFLQLLVGAYKDLEQRYQVMENNLSCLEKVKLSIEHIIGKFSKSEIIEICPDISLSSIELALRTLVKNKKLVREGTGKSTRYYKK